jgi:K(+)-stimulated pyrophosphate-energized sodium pump
MLITWLSIVVALGGFGFAFFLYKKIIEQKIESKEAEVISSYISRGAFTFLFKEYLYLSIFVVVVAIVLFVIPELSWKISLTFIVGAIFSALAGFIAIKISTLANIRTAEKLGHSLRSGFNISFNASSIVGLIISGLGVLGIGLFYVLFKDPQMIYGFGLGASSIALFIRVGGGIYTKAVDVGADMVG